MALFPRVLSMSEPTERNIANIALIVDDYQRAIEYYTQCLPFELVQNEDLGNGKRWVRLLPTNSRGTGLILAKATNSEQKLAVGNQAGGRVFLFLHTQDFWTDYKSMQVNGVCFLEQPREEPYGIVAVFEDLYGNKWDLMQLN